MCLTKISKIKLVDVPQDKPKKGALATRVPFVGSCQECVEPGGCKVFPSGPEHFGDSMGPKKSQRNDPVINTLKLIIINYP